MLSLVYSAKQTINFTGSLSSDMPDWSWLWMYMRLTLHVDGYAWLMIVNRQMEKQNSTLMDWKKYTRRRSERNCVLRRLTGSGSITTTYSLPAVSSFPISIKDSLKCTASFPLFGLLYICYFSHVFSSTPKTNSLLVQFRHLENVRFSRSSQSSVASCFAHERPALDYVPNSWASKLLRRHSVACSHSQRYSKCCGKAIRNPLTLSHALWLNASRAVPD